MIDDAFLRQVAALQANLCMLESQSDALSDLADMKELRLYKAHLTDYIEAHASEGNLPRDPFLVIGERLRAVSEFFAAADQDYQRLKGWKADWLKSVPAVSLDDLLSARADLDQLVAEVPQLQARLAQSVSPLDWDDSMDLHAELLACAQCDSGLNLPPKPETRRSLYQFTRGEGTFAKKTAAHFTAMGLRIEELIALHARHVKALADTDHHIANDAFRSAEKSFQILGKDRFSDVDYTRVESRLTKALGVFAQFTSVDSSLDQRLTKNDYNAVNAELDQLRGLTGKPDSELARESLALLREMDSRVASARNARKKRRVKNFSVISLLVLGITALTYTVINENAKAERVRIEAQAKAEREATEAKTKTEREAAEAKAKADKEAAEAKAKLAAEIGAGRVGATTGVPLAGKAVMPFAFCPSGAFTMGSPTSEEGRSGDEGQVRVTLSKGFWMSKTEVTQAQWRAVMGNNPSSFKGVNLPVEKVSCDDAQEFIKKVNSSGVMPNGWKMALPTEAQWEYACRAGETGPYSGGTIEQVAWYDGNDTSKTHDVGTKKANAWGVHDMHGNVREWCADGYDNTLPGGTDPTGASSGVLRVLRGGSWFNSAARCRAASRNWDFPDRRYHYLGFRPALVPSK